MAEKRDLYYTTNGADPTGSSTPYTGAFEVNDGVTVKSRAFNGNYFSSVTTKVATLVVPAPSINVTTYGRVYLSSSLQGSSIYYTTNGTTPTDASTLYTGMITVNNGTVVKAVAKYKNKLSPVSTSAPVTVILSNPTISVSQAGVITMARAAGDTVSTIRYTTDGSDPTASSPVYSTAISLTVSTLIKARSFALGTSSGVASAYYISLPTITVSNNVVSIDVTDTNVEAIYYTTNGSAPTTSSTRYTVPFFVQAPATVKAIAVAGQFTTNVVSQSIVLPPYITVEKSGKVTIVKQGTGTVRYTTNGSEPTSSSTIYTTPFTAADGATIKAKEFFTAGTTPTSTAYFAKAPVISNSGRTVTLSTGSTGSIYYTTNGAAPTTSSTRYTGAFNLSDNQTVRAIVVFNGFTSNEASRLVVWRLNAPTVNIDSDGLMRITAADNVVATTLHYKRNGQQYGYTAPIGIAGDAITIEAWAYSNAYGVNSAIVTKYFTNPPRITNSGNTVTLSQASGTVTRYTRNGSNVTSTSTQYAAPFYVSYKEQIYARSFFNGYESRQAGLYMDVPNTPSISIDAVNRVTIGSTDTTPGTTYYSINGGSWTAYSAPFIPTVDAEIRAKRISTAGLESVISGSYYTLLAPIISQASTGEISIAQNGSFAAEIRYTTNGSNPTSTSTLYTRPFSPLIGTVKAKRFYAGAVSPMHSKDVVRVSPPTFSPTKKDGVTYVAFEMPPDGLGGTVYYRLNGGAWTTYTGQFVRTTDTLIDTYRVVNGISSEVITGHRTLARPTITQNSNGQTTIAANGTWGVIKFTTDGTAPKETSPTYSNVISMQNLTVRAARFYDAAAWSPEHSIKTIYVKTPGPYINKDTGFFTVEGGNDGYNGTNQYQINGGVWNEYTAPVKLTYDAEVRARRVVNGIYSATSHPLYYLVAPKVYQTQGGPVRDPLGNNHVEMEQNGTFPAAIHYSFWDDPVTTNSPTFSPERPPSASTSYINVRRYYMLDWSPITRIQLHRLSIPSIDISTDSYVSMTMYDGEKGTAYYRINGALWRTYTGRFKQTGDFEIEAYNEIDGLRSQWSSEVALQEPPGVSISSSRVITLTPRSAINNIPIKYTLIPEQVPRDYTGPFTPAAGQFAVIAWKEYKGVKSPTAQLAF